MSDALDVTVDYEQPSTWIADASALRTVREFWSAKLAKRKDQLLSGELLLTEVVRNRCFVASRMTRDHVLRLPDSSAADLAAGLGADVNAVRTLMREAVETALHALAAQFRSKAGPNV